MRTETPTRKEDVRDPIGIAGWPKEKGRDGERTPMQWTSGAQAGFSTNPDTWLPVPANHDTINVETESADPQSLLAWYRTLIGLRASEPALRDGSMTMVDPDNAGVLAWRRQATGGDSVLVAINMTGTSAKLKLGAGDASLDTLAVSDGAAPVPQGDSVTLAPFQSWIARRR